MKNFLKHHFAPHLLVVMLIGLVGYISTIAIDMHDLKQNVELLNDTEGIIERIEKLEVGGLGEVAYAQLSSAKTQRTIKDEPIKIEMEYRDAINGIEFDPRISKTDIEIVHDGTYFVMAAPQVGRLDANETPSCANFFLSINEKPLDNSNVTLCLANDDSSAKDVVVTQGIVPLHKGDKISVMMSSSNSDEGIGAETLAPEDEPVVPSIIFSMFRLGSLEK